MNIYTYHLRNTNVALQILITKSDVNEYEVTTLTKDINDIYGQEACWKYLLITVTEKNRLTRHQKKIIKNIENLITDNMDSYEIAELATDVITEMKKDKQPL